MVHTKINNFHHRIHGWKWNAKALARLETVVPQKLEWYFCCELPGEEEYQAIARFVGRCAYRHLDAYVIPTNWSTSSLWAKGATLSVHVISMSMNGTRLSITIAPPVVSRFLFVEAVEESELCKTHWITLRLTFVAASDVRDTPGLFHSIRTFILRRCSTCITPGDRRLEQLM